MAAETALSRFSCRRGDQMPLPPSVLKKMCGSRPLIDTIYDAPPFALPNILFYEGVHGNMGR